MKINMSASEIMPSAAEDSRCGEIFVSKKADKWTFFCSYCQKGTSDIGVFVCHIRLDHLDSLLDYGTQKENVTPEVEEPIPETSTQPTDILPAKDDVHEKDINLIKEETLSENSFESMPVPTRISKNIDCISPLTDCNETGCVFSAKNTISSGYPTIEINEEYFTITSKDPDRTGEDSVQGNNEIVRVLYGKTEENLKKSDDQIICSGDTEDINCIDTSSIYSIDDDDGDLLVEGDIFFENIDDNKASSSKRRKEDRNLVAQHACEFCNMNFKLRSELDYHLKEIHNQKLCGMRLKCKQSRKVFRSVAGYKNHLNSHDERNQKQCPICKARYNQNYFITHVMGHESDTCFPCMVCGKIFSNHAERIKHWETHAKDKPYACDFCFCRFRQKHFLVHHLKCHGQYKCSFCPEKFVTFRTPRPPYVCPSCEKLPDIGLKIEHRKLIANKNCANESEQEE